MRFATIAFHINMHQSMQLDSDIMSYIHDAGHNVFFRKNLRPGQLEQDEIRQGCSSTKYALNDGVKFLT